MTPIDESEISFISFSNLSYNLIFTSQGKVLETGFSSEFDNSTSCVSRKEKKFTRRIEQLDNFIITRVEAGRISVA